MPSEAAPLIDSSAETAAPRLGQASRWRTLRSGLLSLLDQAFVSGARFATSILLGRFAGREELGAYSMGFGLLLLVLCVLEALIAAPYIVLHARREQDAKLRTFNGSSLLHCALLSAVASGGFLLAALFVDGGSGLSTIFVALAISSPPAVLREFARRMEFAHLRQHMACLIDGTVALLQVTGLLLLGWQGLLTSGRAFLVMGAASAATSVFWLAVLRENFDPRLPQLGRDTRDAWRLGKWAFLAQTTGLIHLQGMNWLINAWLGLEQTGLFAACSTLVLFINPFALGLNNFVAPLAVRTAHQRGVTAVKRLIGKAMALMCVSVFFFTTLIFFSADYLMQLLFDDPAYQGQQTLIMLLGINITLNAVHMVNDGGVWALERPRIIFVSAVVSVVVTFSLSAVMIPTLGLIGAAWSLLIGRIAAAALEASVFFFGFSSTARDGEQAAKRAAETNGERCRGVQAR